MMFPLAGYRAPDDPVLLGPESEICAGAFFARVQELADALPNAPFVINLSEGRTGFMLGFAAALVRGQTSLFPPGQGRGDWEHLAQQYPGASIISDRAIDAPRAFDLTPYLAMDDEFAGDMKAFALPIISGDFKAAMLFTSGSTGHPAAHVKSWGQLARGAANLFAALGWTGSTRHAVIGSVPPQHMFGLEATVMLPWYAGIPVHTHKPLLPADLDAALEQCARPCWWMTTPVHLRAPLQSASTLPRLAGIVASTMSLPRALAAAAEAGWQAPVVEIYGSTETGALAARRTAADEWWTPLQGVVLEQCNDGDARRVRAAGTHIDVPVLLSDELHFNPDGRFRWLGRSADMLKIGGKRASLSALNQQIADIPGVEDAVYFVPDAAVGAASHDDAHPARRLAAFYVSSTLTPEQLREQLRAHIDPVFVPRPLFRVRRLPRNANGKLTHRALTAMFTQLKQVPHPAAVVDGAIPSLVVPLDHPAIPGHFPGNPIVPGVLILTRVADEIRRQLPGIVLGSLLATRFYAPLRPGQPFAVNAELTGDRVRFDVRTQVYDDNEHGVFAKVIAAGQWACDVGACLGGQV